MGTNKLPLNSDFCVQSIGSSTAYPIRAFCSAYVDLEPIDGLDWLDSELEREELDDNMMYIWLGGYEITFFHVALAPIEQYKSWTREKFLEELSILSEKYNKD